MYKKKEVCIRNNEIIYGQVSARVLEKYCSKT
jgi:hypothetical protein